MKGLLSAPGSNIKMKHKGEVNWRRLVLSGGLLMVVLLLAALLLMGREQGARSSAFSLPVVGKRLALVRVEGPIFSAEQTVDLLQRCLDNDKIKRFTVSK